MRARKPTSRRDAWARSLTRSSPIATRPPARQRSRAATSSAIRASANCTAGICTPTSTTASSAAWCPACPSPPVTARRRSTSTSQSASDRTLRPPVRRLAGQRSGVPTRRRRAARLLAAAAAVLCTGPGWRNADPACRARPRSARDHDHPSPRGWVSRRRVGFRFAADEAGAGFQCRLNARVFRPCSSPKRYAGQRPAGIDSESGPLI